jgi:hypothetical protein
MSHTTEDLGLLGYKSWRKSLELLPLETALKFVKGHIAHNRTNSINPNQIVKIINIEFNEIPADSVYTFKLLNGKRTFVWRAEGIHRKIVDGEIVIVNNG